MKMLGLMLGPLPQIIEEEFGTTADGVDLNLPANRERMLDAAERHLRTLPVAEVAAWTVSSTWRSAVEAFPQRLVDDHLMVWANIKATIDLMTACEGAFGVSEAMRVLTDPRRIVIPGVEAATLFAADWDAFVERVHVEALGYPFPLVVLVGAAFAGSDKWWGTRRYAERVEAFVTSEDAAGWEDKDDLRRRLLDDPLAIQPDEWGRIIHTRGWW